MKQLTEYLEGAALHWAVARCLGKRPSLFIFEQTGDLAREHAYSTDWSLAGPIIESYHIAIWWDGVWHSKLDGCQPHEVQDAFDPLVAAMRCYVYSELGETVDIPDELT